MSYSDRDDDRVTRGPFDTVNIDDDDTFDASEDESEGNARGWLLLLAVVLVLAALAGVVYFAYQQGREEGIRTAPPVVRADGGPEKVAPQDPGGMDIPHQDKQIFERIQGEETDDGVEHLLPPPEEPMTAAEETATAEEETAAAEAEPEPAAPAPQPAQPQAAAEPAPASPARPITPPAASTTPAPSGSYVVQVGAFRNMTRANAEWSALAARHPELLDGYGPDVQEADLGDKGIWYRLRVAAFGSKADAASFCGKLKSAGTDCLVRQR